jgi:DNA-binding NtrC family response regulator
LAVATVLVVDDDLHVRGTLRRMLTHLGHAVVEAGTAAEGMASIASADLMLLDVRLPDASGVELLDAIAAARPGLAVLLVTGLDEDARPAAPPAALRFGFLRKPFMVRDLREAIDDLVR